MPQGWNEFEALTEQYIDTSDLEAAAKLSRTFRDVVVEFESFVEKTLKELSLKNFSWVFEMSLHSHDRGRVHLHLYMNDDDVSRFIGIHIVWRFRGSYLTPLQKLLSTMAIIIANATQRGPCTSRATT